MILDATWFGYGAGLVMVGWFAGMTVNLILTAIRSIR